MLQAMREKAQGWIAWVIVVLIALTFIIFWGGGSFLDPTGQSSEPAAVVNGEMIPTKVVERQYQQIISQPNANVGHLSPEEIKAKILDSLIEEVLLKQGAEKLGLRVSPHRIDSTLKQLPIFQDNGVFSPVLYQRFMMSMGMTEKELKSLFEQQLLQQQLYSAVAGTNFMIEPDIKAFTDYFFQKRSFKYTVVEREQYAEQVSVSDDEIKTFYDENNKDFYTDELVKLEYVLLSLDDLKKDFVPDDKGLKQYYETNLELYRKPERRLLAHIYLQVAPDAKKDKVQAAKQNIEKIYQQLQNKVAFEELAKEFSDDKQTKDKGGKLDWIVKGEIGIPEFEKVAFSLKKGEYSQPLKTDYGFHIIKLIDQQDEKVQPFAEVKQKVKEQMQTRKAEEQIITKVDRLTNLAYDYPDSLMPIQEEMGINVQKSDFFSNNQAAEIDDKVLSHPKVVEAAFSEYVKLQGNNSDTIKLDDSNYAVIRVVDNKEPELKPLAEVKESIHSLMLFQKTNEKAEAAANEILKQLKSTNNIDTILNQYQWKETSGISLNSDEEDRYILETVFQLKRPQNAKEISADVAQLVNSDYAVIWLSDVEFEKADNLNKQEVEQLRNYLEKQAGELEFILYTKALNEQAKIDKES